ncbi:hypothetical protein UlMin_029372 [Ulmus minor]
MENIVSDLNVSQVKQDVLSKTFDSLHSQATGVLLLTLQWKDLESHFNLIRKSLQEKLEEILERDNGVRAKENRLEAKELELNSEIESEAKKLDEMERLIEERSNEVELKLEKLDAIDRVNVELLKDLKRNRQEFDSLEVLIREKQRELDDTVKKNENQKERDFDRIGKAIREREEKLEVLERSIKEMSEEIESKERKLELLRGALKKYEDDVGSLEHQNRLVGISLEGCKRELELKEEKLRVCRRSIDESNKEINQSKEKLDFILHSIATCSSEMELKQKRLDLVLKEVESKEDNLVLLKKSVEQCAREFEVKEGKFKVMVEELESKRRSVTSKIEELDLISKKVGECIEEDLGLLQRKVEESSRELEIKESEFNKRVFEFELSQKEIESMSQVKIEQLENVPINNAIVPSPARLLNLLPKDGKGLQAFLNWHFKTHESVGSEISHALGEFSDPAKFVLDAMEGFYPSHLSSENATFDLSVVRKSCILLLEQLMKASPQIDPQVREEAMTLAGDWKGKMTAATANYLEVLGFLQLVASYRLASAFDVDELHNLLDIIYQQRQGSELSAALFITDKAFVKDEQVDNSLAKSVERFLNEGLTGNDLTQNDIVTALQMPDSAKHVLEIMRHSFSLLWERGDVGFEESAIKRYILLFEKLLTISPHIPIQLCEDARKLAVKWKSKLGANKENILEVLIFLQFLVIYELIWSFDEDEILKFLGMISCYKEAPEFYQILSLYKIPRLVQSLIRRKKLIEAIRLSCVFKLTHKFSPRLLLIEYLEDAKEYTINISKKDISIEEKDKATDKEIDALRTALQCIQDYNLESEFYSGNILKRISLLEKIKRDRNHSATFFFNPELEQQQQQPTKKRSNASSDPEKRPQQNKTKFPRTVASNVRPSRMEHRLIYPS